MPEPTMWDSSYWANLMKPAAQKWNTLKSFTGQADAIAEREFPGSARDASMKNAFRHALGTGILTHELGGGPIAAGIAKMAGYGWEGASALGELRANGRLSQDFKRDSLHDLNANSIGAGAAQYLDRAALIQHLKGLATNAAVAEPPGVFSPNQGRLSRTVR